MKNEVENLMERWHLGRADSEETLQAINDVFHKNGKLSFFNKNKPIKEAIKDKEDDKYSTLIEIIEANLKNIKEHDKYNITTDMEIVSRTKQATFSYILQLLKLKT